MTPTRQVVQQFLRHRSAGDIDAMLALFQDPIDFRSYGSPRVPWLRSTTSRDGAREFFTALFDAVTPAHTNVDAIIVDDTEAVITGDLDVKVNATGRLFSSPFALRLTVREGLIVRHHVFEDSYALHQAISPETPGA